MVKEITRLLSSQSFKELRSEALKGNEWFTEEFIDIAIGALEQEFLCTEKVSRFCAENSIDGKKRKGRVGIIAAGNIPLVGFGDMFYALLCGWDVVLKPSSKDPLMRIFADLEGVNVVNSIEEFENIDALALMGSDETCSYIRKKFPNTPLLLRGSMHSVALLPSTPLSHSELEGLFSDIFLYSGRGCRNVSHLVVPTGYDITQLSEELREASTRVSWNLPPIWYDQLNYNRAVATLRGEKFIDGSDFLLQEHYAPSSQPTILTYEYSNEKEHSLSDKIQHIAQRGNFGLAQYPTLQDFANGLSVTNFLLEL